MKGFLIFLVCLFLVIPSFGQKMDDDIFYETEDYLKKNDHANDKEFFEKNYTDHIGIKGALFHYNYGKALIASKKYYNAIPHLTKSYIYAEKGSKLQKESLLLKAQVLSSLGLYYEASNLYKIFINTFKKSEYDNEAHLGLARTLVKTGNFSDALSYFDKLGKDPIALFEKANALQMMGKTNEASEAYRTAILLKPEYLLKSEVNLYYYSLNAMERNLIDVAKKNLSIINSLPIKYRAALLLGEISFEENNLDKAMGLFKLALESPEKDVKAKALLNIAKAYLKLNDRNKAEEYLLKLLSLAPYTKFYYEGLLIYSDVLFQNGRIDKALKYLKILIFKKDPIQEAYNFIERIYNFYLEKGQYSEVYELWQKTEMLMLERLKIETLFKIINILKDRNDKKFLSILQYISKKDDNTYSVNAKVMLADYYIKEGDMQRARFYLVSIPRKNLNDEIKRLFVKFNYLNGYYEEAYKSLTELSKIEEGDLIYLSKLIALEKKLPRKIAFLEKALKDVGEDAAIFELLGDIYKETKDKKKMVFYYERALQKKPDDNWIKYKLSKISEEPQKKEFLADLAQSNNTIFKNLAKMNQKEEEILEKLKRRE